MSHNESAAGEARPDHSGFIDHLRIVHLTLFLTCFVAIIAVAGKSSSSMQRAYEQSNLLLKLQTKWNGGRWLKDFVDNNQVQNASVETKVEVGGNTPRTFDFRRAQTGEYARYSWFTFATMKNARLTKLTPPPFQHAFANIEDAEIVWNMLAEFHNAYMVTATQVHDGWMIRGKSVLEAKLNGGKPMAISNANPTVENILRTSWVLEPDVQAFVTSEGDRLSAARELVEKHEAQSYFIVYSDIFQGYLLFPVDCKIEKVDLPKLLGDSIIPAEFPLGDFKHSFPDASDLGKNLKSLKLTELRDYFQAEQSRTGDKVELPLVKIPAESIASWGTTIIFLLATYWFAVFRDFWLRAKPDDKAWQVPWIGTSNEYWSQILFLATTLLPSCTAAYLIFYGVGRSFGLESRVSLAFVAFVLVGLPTAGTVFLWRQIRLVYWKKHW